MCGIAGVVQQKGEVSREKLVAMTDRLARRGPDGAGYWLNVSAQVGLGHRRLSILDLSAAGAQPMVSPSGRYHITFNGEIYNFRELRAELETKGIRFRGHSDTEVILAACDAWGIAVTLSKLDGMFAFALWDEAVQALTLVRDRLGIKPLYYAVTPTGLIFASEVRPIVQWMGAVPPIAPAALSEYLRLSYVPAPLSIFEGIYKLPPGSIASYRDGQFSGPRQYWDLATQFRAGLRAPIMDEGEALATLDARLRQTVKRHMVADVPLGAFLSGGVDSSIVVALMQAQSNRAVKSFSIGFEQAAFNEAEHAATVAKHLATDHQTLIVTDADARAVIPQLPEMYDEPFADASQIPTYLVSKLARAQVTVALSGDGGDELFGGYNRYRFMQRFWNRLTLLPAPVRAVAMRLLTMPNQTQWDRIFRVLSPLLPSGWVPALPGEKMYKIARVLSARDPLEAHTLFTSLWHNPAHILAPGWRTGSPPWYGALEPAADLQIVERQMLWDLQTYLVDDILTKVDRASMAVGLEARVPLLDHHMVELALRIPLSMKLRGGDGKWLLRQLLYQHVPMALIERPKMGFSVPLDAWLRGPLRGWAESYLQEDCLRAEGYWDVDTIRQIWQAHTQGKGNFGGVLWNILMFQTWLEKTRTWL